IPRAHRHVGGFGNFDRSRMCQLRRGRSCIHTGRVEPRIARHSRCVIRRESASSVGWVGDRFFFHAGDGIRYYKVTGVQTCALPISGRMVTDLPTGRLLLERGYRMLAYGPETALLGRALREGLEGLRAAT